jgi:hypothetical protein
VSPHHHQLKEHYSSHFSEAWIEKGQREKEEGMQGKLLFSDSSPFDKKALLLSDTVKNYKTPLRYR